MNKQLDMRMKELSEKSDLKLTLELIGYTSGAILALWTLIFQGAL